MEVVRVSYNVDKYVADEIKNIRDKNYDKGILTINQNFSSALLEYVFFTLHDFELNRNIDNIKIYINSNGGDVTALLPIIDYIKLLKKPVHTIVLGKAYSAGAILLLSGHAGKRCAYKNSEILLHEVASEYEYMKVTEMNDTNKRLNRTNETLISIIKERTKMSRKTIEKFMTSNRDIFISAEESLQYGIIDKIIQ